MRCKTIQFAVAFSDVRVEEEGTLRNRRLQLDWSLSSAQAGRIKQKSHRGDKQCWKAKNHSATKLAVGKMLPSRKSFAPTQRSG